MEANTTGAPIAHPDLVIEPAMRRKMLAMDFLVHARNDPGSSRRTVDEYISVARRHGLTVDEIAAGLGTSSALVTAAIADGGS
ncbi:hypothetical protein [Pseudarthrobacter sp. NamE5]|uniref:hypothetical protein n=1 Tax=Pseudarthrobacter sp. NamE5 TaxID=2576839 RepID=UPI00110BFA96|nr:hypothetical protein [Pseudarthrobacter sp. NamE5]TLM87225.1 hypothetical protein FDW84_05370 [Pseudarthrobacter sp. NamE5]